MTHKEFNHIISSINALSPDQMRQLARELESRMAATVNQPAPTGLTEKELADQELQRRLFEAGVVSEIKPPRRATGREDRFTPVPIQGEPLSETVIRERR